MEQTETQKVLAMIDESPGVDVAEIAKGTGLGHTAVGLIVDELELRKIIQDDDQRDRWGVSRFGDEIMQARAAAGAGGLPTA